MTYMLTSVCVFTEEGMASTLCVLNVDSEDALSDCSSSVDVVSVCVRVCTCLCMHPQVCMCECCVCCLCVLCVCVCV